MKKILMPETLTAENGAKAALMGEFFEHIEVSCPSCDENGEVTEECEDCNGYGTIRRSVPVSWTTIKEIYKRAVEVVGEQMPEVSR